MGEVKTSCAGSVDQQSTIMINGDTYLSMTASMSKGENTELCVNYDVGMDNYDLTISLLNSTFIIPTQSSVICIDPIKEDIGDVADFVTATDTLIACLCCNAFDIFNNCDRVCPLDKPTFDENAFIFLEDQQELSGADCSFPSIETPIESCIRLLLPIEDVYQINKVYIQDAVFTYFLQISTTDPLQNDVIIKIEDSDFNEVLSPIIQFEAITHTTPAFKVDYDHVAIRKNPVSGNVEDIDLNTNVWFLNDDEFNSFGIFNPLSPCFVQHKEKYILHEKIGGFTIPGFDLDLNYNDGNIVRDSLIWNILSNPCPGGNDNDDDDDDYILNAGYYDITLDYEILSTTLTNGRKFFNVLPSDTKFIPDLYKETPKIFENDFNGDINFNIKIKDGVFVDNTIHIPDPTFVNMSCVFSNSTDDINCDFCVINNDATATGGGSVVLYPMDSSLNFGQKIFNLNPSQSFCLSEYVSKPNFVVDTTQTIEFCIQAQAQPLNIDCVTSNSFTITHRETSTSSSTSYMGTGNDGSDGSDSTPNSINPSDDDDDSGISITGYIAIGLGILAMLSLFGAIYITYQIIRKGMKNKNSKMSLFELLLLLF